MPNTRKPALEPEVRINFKFQASQAKLLHKITRGAGTYVVLRAPECLEVGGQRSGKTVGKLMHGILEYCLRYPKCDILVLRRTISELDNIVQDVRTLIPQSMYTYVASPNKVITFTWNGSRIVFGGCANDVERDIEKYLGQAYPYIQVSECAQFSPEIWERLAMRNLVNAACQPDEHGNVPIPRIVGDTNPIGAHWEYYYTKFVKKQPWNKPEGARQDREGRWYVLEAGEMRCFYDPQNYAYNHTTILDNKEYMKRDPGMIDRLNAMSGPMREIFLQGRMDGVSGQFFDCWAPDYHIVDLRDDTERIIWQPWQPVWAGQDWGVGGQGHTNAFYLFTKALVKSAVGGDPRVKTVCFREIAPRTSVTKDDYADLIRNAAYYPRLPQDHPQYELISGKPCKVRAIYFSHEKFNRVLEAHSPADEYSKVLRARGLPPVSRATRDRIGSAGYMYSELKMGNIVILRSCEEIIHAIPTLQRDPKQLDDVLKTNARSDDLYDGFRLGLYGGFRDLEMPQDVRDRIEMDKMDPWQKHFRKMKLAGEQKKRTQAFTQPEAPFWQRK